MSFLRVLFATSSFFLFRLSFSEFMGVSISGVSYFEDDYGKSFMSMLGYLIGEPFLVDFIDSGNSASSKLS